MPGSEELKQKIPEQGAGETEKDPQVKQVVTSF